MAGSAPKRRNTGTTTGRSTVASTGARHTMPTMARAKEPMAWMPFSNSWPMPNRLPKIRSNAPNPANAAIRVMSTLSADIISAPS